MKLPIALLSLCAVSALANPTPADSKPKLLEPYIAKPSAEPPKGWAIRVLAGAEVDTKSALDKNKTIELTVPAYEMYPLPADDIRIIREPGFNPALGNKQKDTLGASITSYLEQIDAVDTKLATVADSIEKALNLDKPLPSASPTPKGHRKP
jgi:hypothetical protein